MVYYINLTSIDAQRYESVYTWTFQRHPKTASKMRMLSFDIVYDDGTGDHGAWECYLGTRIEVIGNTIAHDLLPDKESSTKPLKNGTILGIIPYEVTRATGVANTCESFEPNIPLEVTFANPQSLDRIVLQFYDVNTETFVSEFVNDDRHSGQKCDLDQCNFSILLEIEE